MFNQKKTLFHPVKMLAVAALAVSCSGLSAFAQTTAAGGNGAAPALSAQQVLAMRQEMTSALNYKLSPDVLPRLTSTLQAIHAAGIQPPGRAGMSLAQQIDMVSKTDKLEPILKANGFTARDFVMSLTCVGLTGSLMNVQGHSGIPQPDAQNVALLKAHPDQLQALIAVLRSESGQ
ncbi:MULTISPECIES: hypothetical protein [Acetobacter]|uniref:DUF4142 domain-containing protein n=1 Tax=Acetobacter thailandicus TaxID=1502842 RepID=A0ABT3QH11_9PROT|nr:MULTISPECIES: hypothetical protein [Acetobacter]MBS0961306.1 hypothetical protein [Acetobacter thailandicus]MBS0986281.1 hypothetical protein [Acetobacter thailandicus]MBS1003055.1 hypothetical protein [Acetobacter thailandicus]MCX2564573.1 hypothetical protein [Acetobacter thailandicus]NHN95961.1 hypothetical protein [Acetobacter thailandicus]